MYGQTLAALKLTQGRTQSLVPACVPLGFEPEGPAEPCEQFGSRLELALW